MENTNALFSSEEAGNFRRLERADQANEFLRRVLDIGQYMLQSGGEVSRVEDSIRRMSAAFGAERADVFTITSSIMVTIYAPDFGTVTQTRRVGGQQFDLSRLESLNQLSRRICADHLTLAETDAALAEIQGEKQYPFALQIFLYAAISASFSLFFGGSAMDAVASGIIGVGLKCLDRLIRRMDANALLSSLLCSCLGGVLAALSVRLGLGESADMISIGNIMLLIPGIALTNSLRDMFSGNTISGLLRFSEAILLALVIAFGFALAGAVL